MKVDVIYEKGIICEFVYSPLFEMFCALHVLTNEEHHLHRNIWTEKVNGIISNEMKKEIRDIGKITESYLIVMDFCNQFKECTDLSLLSSIEFLKDLPLYRINKIFKLYNKKISTKEYSRLLELLKDFYIEIFENELKYIEPIITRTLRKKANFCKEKGLFNLVESIHERIKVFENEIVFYKYKEIRINKNDIKYITINLSTFISPHLLLGEEKEGIHLTALVELQDYEKNSYKDLERRLKALGDGTRLRILKEINKIGKSTQELSGILNISEAATSKALKILLEAELVTKLRRGNYIIYSLNKIEIDYLPYKIYEYLN